MLSLIADLFEYQAWADARIVAAVKAHAPAAEDEQLRVLLHHIVSVQRFFLTQCAGETFDVETEMRVPGTLKELETLFLLTHTLGLSILGTMAPDALPGILDAPPLDQLKPTVRTALTQAVLHSQHHRGQVATRLRALGGVPPTVDDILWKKDRP
jgi:uncharacterized damage-inducible protein DinB